MYLIDVPKYVASVNPEHIKKVAESPSIFVELLTTYSFRAEDYIAKMTETQVLQLIKHKAVLDEWVKYVCSFGAPITGNAITAEHTKKLLPKTFTFIAGNYHYYGNKIIDGRLSGETVFRTDVDHTNTEKVIEHFNESHDFKTKFTNAYNTEHKRAQKLLTTLIHLLKQSADHSLDEAFHRKISDVIGVGGPREATQTALNGKNYEILHLIFSKLSHKAAITELFIGGQSSVFSQLVEALPDAAANTALFKVVTPLAQDANVKALLESWVKKIPTLTLSKLDNYYTEISKLLRGMMPTTTASAPLVINSIDTELKGENNNNNIEEDTPVTLFANNLTLTDMSKKNNQNQYIYYPNVLTENILPKPDTLFIIAEHNLMLAMLYIDKCTDIQLKSIAAHATQHLLASFIVCILSSDNPEAAKRLLETIGTEIRLNISKRCTMRTWKNILDKDKSKAIMGWVVMGMDKETAQANMAENNNLYAVLVENELYWPAQVLTETSEKTIPPLSKKFIAWITAQISKMNFNKNTDFDTPPLKSAFVRLAIQAWGINTSVDQLLIFAKQDTSVAMKFTLLFTNEEIDHLIKTGHELYPGKFFETLIIGFEHNTPLAFIEKASPELIFDFTQFHDDSTELPIVFPIFRTISIKNNAALMEALFQHLSHNDINFLCSTLFSGTLFITPRYNNSILLPQLHVLCGQHTSLSGKFLCLDEIIPYLMTKLPESNEALTLAISTVIAMENTPQKQNFLHKLEKHCLLLTKLIDSKKTNLAKQLYLSCPEAFNDADHKKTQAAVCLLKAMDKTQNTKAMDKTLNTVVRFSDEGVKKTYLDQSTQTDFNISPKK